MYELNAKVLKTLAIVTLLIATVAVSVSYIRQSSSNNEQIGANVLSGLGEHVNDVNAVIILGANEQVLISLENTPQQGWVVREKAAYPANVSKLRELLLELANARILEPKTTSESRYAELGVEDIKAANAQGILVKLVGLEQPTELLIGHISAHSNGTFVRRPDARQSWLVQGQISVERDPWQWLDSSLIDFGGERIYEVVLSKAGAKSIRLYKQQTGDVNFQLADVPPSRVALGSESLNALAARLSNLIFADVLSRTGSIHPDVSHLMTAHYLTVDGLVVDVGAWQQNGKYYAQLQAKLDTEKAEQSIRVELSRAKANFIDGNTSKIQAGAARQSTGDVTEILDAVADPEQYRLHRLETLNTEVTNLNKRFDSWYFQIAPVIYSIMDRTIDDLLQPQSAPKAYIGQQSGRSRSSGTANLSVNKTVPESSAGKE
ncbi:DUF4340 domain-containing protein [Methylomonas paludis]|uniref:DUF4340 domain-containing protein n=1 Tax=Methylomonas paludis TaxID=1173101 RepID=A0A975MM09_9GAMM|nr:DUF4340 domain-containing protein [Methylomonas paludis]QWF70363.1 DUF4340 domain-containing protein [Methylomonas paludis]